MNQKSLNTLAEHMNHFGLHLLTHSIEHLFFAAYENYYWNAFGVLHAAQAGEIIIKSCIAKEHPLLIFSKLPKYDEGILDEDKLFAKGITANYQDLPNILWATTGYHIANQQMYQELGKLRNIIQHLHVPSGNFDLIEHTLKYLCEVIDPIQMHFWQSHIFDNMPVEDEYIYEPKYGLGSFLTDFGINYDGHLP